MLYFFNYRRLLVSLPLVGSRISRIGSWPCWNVCSLISIGTTRRGRQAEKAREGWRLDDRCVHYFVLDVFLVAGAAGPAEQGAAILPGMVGGDGGDDAPQPYVVRRSKL